MEINARMRELYAERRSITFIKALREEFEFGFGLSLSEAKEVLVELGQSEEWERNGFKDKSLLAMEVEDEEIEGL